MSIWGGTVETNGEAEWTRMADLARAVAVMQDSVTERLARVATMSNTDRTRTLAEHARQSSDRARALADEVAAWVEEMYHHPHPTPLSRH